jgi:hypothetical protein
MQKKSFFLTVENYKYGDNEHNYKLRSFILSKSLRLIGVKMKIFTFLFLFIFSNFLNLFLLNAQEVSSSEDKDSLVKKETLEQTEKEKSEEQKLSLEFFKNKKIDTDSEMMHQFFQFINVKYLTDYSYAPLLHKSMFAGNADEINSLIKFLKKVGVGLTKILKPQLNLPSTYLQFIPTINGFGLFAKELIKKDQEIGFYLGEVIYIPNTKVAMYIPEDFAKQLKSIGITGNLGEFILNNSQTRRHLFGHDSEQKTKGAYYFNYLSSIPHIEGTSAVCINASHEGNVLRFVNHSNVNINTKMELKLRIEIDPENSKKTIRPVLVLIAEKDIQPDSQILYNYGDTYWKNLGVNPLDL